MRWAADARARRDSLPGITPLRGETAAAEGAGSGVQTQFEDDQVQSVAFNSEHDDMLAYSGAGTLSIRTAGFKPYRQRMDGLVVAFRGAKVYCLHGAAVREEDVPLSSTVQQYAEVKAWGAAYSVACLGVTQEDWTALGQAALMHLELGTARKAFIRTQDLLMLNLVHRLELLGKSGVVADVLKGEVLAYQVRSCCLCASLPHLVAEGMYLLRCNRGSGRDALTQGSVHAMPSVRTAGQVRRCVVTLWQGESKRAHY